MGWGGNCYSSGTRALCGFTGRYIYDARALLSSDLPINMHISFHLSRSLARELETIADTIYSRI